MTNKNWYYGHYLKPDTTEHTLFILEVERTERHEDSPVPTVRFFGKVRLRYNPKGDPREEDWTLAEGNLTPGEIYLHIRHSDWSREKDNIGAPVEMRGSRLGKSGPYSGNYSTSNSTGDRFGKFTIDCNALNDNVSVREE